MKMNIKPDQVMLMISLVLVGYLMCKPKKSSYKKSAVMAYPIEEQSGASCKNGACEVQPGSGLSSSLLPKEAKPQEIDVGAMSPDKLLQGQSFIHGQPGSITSSLRNANQQLRSDPFIKKEPVSIFNQSTIAPDRMRPKFEIGATGI